MVASHHHADGPGQVTDCSQERHGATVGLPSPAPSGSDHPQKLTAALRGFLGFQTPNTQSCEHHLLPLKNSLQRVIKTKSADTGRLSPSILWNRF